MARNEPQCTATVFGPRAQHWSCQRRGVVERKGKWFCGQHDPERHTVSVGAALLWLWERWDDKPQCFAIIKRSAKQVIATKIESAYVRTFVVHDEGQTWFSSELAAWRHRVQRKEIEIQNLKREIHDARTQLGMAQSHVKALEKATSVDARLTDSKPGAAIGSADQSSSSGDDDGRA